MWGFKVNLLPIHWRALNSPLYISWNWLTLSFSAISWGLSCSISHYNTAYCIIFLLSPPCTIPIAGSEPMKAASEPSLASLLVFAITWEVRVTKNPTVLVSPKIWKHLRNSHNFLLWDHKNFKFRDKKVWWFFQYCLI